MLKNLNLKAVYNSEEDNILSDFYIPALSESISYDRAVGYFDAKMLISAAQGIASFIENGGHMRLICGSTLTDEEYIAISNGYSYTSKQQIKERLSEEFLNIVKNSSKTNLFSNQLNALSWLVQHGKLDVKIALRRHGIHHQKVGVFKDSNGDFLVFQGSANETNSALLPYNFETINVYQSWRPEFREHIDPHLETFNKLWDNNYPNTLVLDFTQIALNVMSENLPAPKKPSILDEVKLWQEYFNETTAFEFHHGPNIPKLINGNAFKLHDHQRAALEGWKKKGFRGLFELATGSGKTITSIYGAVKIYKSRNNRLLLVIAVPYQNLADQWLEVLKIFNIEAIACYGGEHSWKTELEKQMADFNARITDFCAAVVVNATLSSKSNTFKNIISSLRKGDEDHFLFIGDECHHHGAEKNFEALPQNANLRIGLSATPDRGDEDEGNNRLRKYYGETVAEYSMEDALKDKVLTPYDYFLVPVELTPEESVEYVKLSAQIAKLYAINTNSKQPSSDALNSLRSKRSRLINGAANKHIELRKLLTNIKPIYHSLFYCAEGKPDESVSNIENKEGLKQVDFITKILDEFGWRSSKFTSDEKKSERESILKNFGDMNIHSLVAMKCLDEGIDIPACSTAFILSSSRTSRQFIQRRGRILRKSPGKSKATIYDFFVTIPDEYDYKRYGENLLRAELERISEFSKLSINKFEAYETLTPYLDKYELHHLL